MHTAARNALIFDYEAGPTLAAHVPLSVELSRQYAIVWLVRNAVAPSRTRRCEINNERAIRAGLLSHQWRERRHVSVL